LIYILKQLDFRGEITIEYELAGRNSEYLLKTKGYLENIIKNS